MSLAELNELPSSPHPFNMERHGVIESFLLSPNSMLNAHVVSHEGSSLATIKKDDDGFTVSPMDGMQQDIGTFETIHLAVSAAVSS